MEMTDPIIIAHNCTYFTMIKVLFVKERGKLVGIVFGILQQVVLEWF